MTEPAAATVEDVQPAEALTAEIPPVSAPEASVVAEVEAEPPIKSPEDTPSAEAPPEPDPEPVAADSGDSHAPDVGEVVDKTEADAASPVAEDVIAHAAEAIAEELKVEPVETATAEMAADTVEAIAEAVASDADSAPSAPDAETNAEAAAVATAPSAPASAYEVDESVLAILREEADREAKARAAETQRLEMQPDLGVEAAAPAKQKPDLVVIPSAASVLETDAADSDIELKTATRRDLLPDVEEINSTLRPSEVPAEPDMSVGVVAADQKTGGFRTGFLTMMTIAILGAVLYIAAPTLSRLVPALADVLMAYVGMVDSLRLSLDGMMQSATLAINGQ